MSKNLKYRKDVERQRPYKYFEMAWLNDDIKKKARNRVGRPIENPFPSSGVEEDFVVRGRHMIEHYYVDDPTSKTSFHLSDHKQISKTAFWSYIFIYYTETKDLADNLQGFHFRIVEHFGPTVTSDRTSIVKCVKKFRRYFVHHKHSFSNLLSQSEQNAQAKYRDQYQYVTNLWEGIDI